MQELRTSKKAVICHLMNLELKVLTIIAFLKGITGLSLTAGCQQN